MSVKLPEGQKYPAEQTPVQLAVDRPELAPYEPAAHGPEHVAEDNPALAPYKPALHSVDAFELLGQNDLKINGENMRDGLSNVKV